MNPRPIALGCMRLSTEPDRNDERSIAVLHAAFDAGVMLLDTADAYCWDESERGHNERLIARAISTFPGRPPIDPDTNAGTATTARSFPGRNFCEGARPQVATKGGLTRPDGRWEPDGRAKHLMAACERSCRALDLAQIDLYQLHAPDSRTPLATSVRALAALKRNGLIASIGLCNVTVGQIEEAKRITEIDSIQVEASVWHDAAFLSGVADYCIANQLTLLAYRPLGGRKARARTAADPALNAVAARHGVTPFEVALAWLADLSDLIVPLPGVTRVETARSAAAAMKIALTDDDRRILDGRFPAGRSIREGSAPGASVSIRRDAEVVLVMGLPGAGKTTFAERFVAGGYQRLNRDETGGTLRELIPELDRTLAGAPAKVVLDNTYLSRKSRAEVIRAAAGRGARVRCIWLATALEDAQVNAVERLVSRYGRLPDARELNALRKRDVAAFLPTAQFRAQRDLEPPDAAEGFSRIEVLPFERRIDPSHVNRAVLVWLDDVLLRSRSGQRTPANADDVLVAEDRAAILRRYHNEGWRVLGLSWQPEVADGSRSAADVHAVFARMNQLIDKPSGGDKPSAFARPASAFADTSADRRSFSGGWSGLSIPVEYCPHPAGPPRCWCRKPLPGLGVLHIHRHQLDPAQCIYVGEGAQDPGFARKLGFKYLDAKDFFGDLAIS